MALDSSGAAADVFDNNSCNKNNVITAMNFLNSPAQALWKRGKKLQCLGSALF